MIRQTGGFALGATSIKSNERSLAAARACWIGTTPTCTPFSSISRTCEARMRSLMRYSFSIPETSVRQGEVATGGQV
jgi:hypothetical protein